MLRTRLEETRRTSYTAAHLEVFRPSCVVFSARSCIFQAWRTRWKATRRSFDCRSPPVRVRRRLHSVGQRVFIFQARGEKRWPKQIMEICRWRFWQIQNRPNLSNQQASPTPPLQVPQPQPLCLPWVDPKRSPPLKVQLPGPRAIDSLQPLLDALLLGSPSVAFYAQSLHEVHAHPSFTLSAFRNLR